MGAKLDLYDYEHEQLLRSGHLVIDDPIRGHIEIWLYFDENKPGIVGKTGKFIVHRAGSAARQAPD